MELSFLLILAITGFLYEVLGVLYARWRLIKQRNMTVLFVSILSFVLVSFLNGWFTIPVFEQGAGWHKLLRAHYLTS